MASARQIHVGGVPDRGRRARRRPDDDQDGDRQPRGDDGPDPPRRRGRRRHRALRRPARAGRRGAARRSSRESPIPIIADIHFNHTLALKALDAGAHCVRLNPGNIGGPDKVAEVVAKAQGSSARRCASASTPARCPSTCASSSSPTRSRRSSPPRSSTVELMERLDFYDFKVSMKSTSVPEHDRVEPAAGRADPLPAAPRRHRGGHEVVGLAEERGRPRHAAGRRHRRHDPHLALDLPRRGGGQGRLGDPQGAQAARARPGPDRLPDVRAPAVRHGLGRRRGRAPPGGLRGPDRGLRSSAARSTASARRATPTSASPAPRTRG